VGGGRRGILKTFISNCKKEKEKRRTKELRHSLAALIEPPCLENWEDEKTHEHTSDDLFPRYASV